MLPCSLKLLIGLSPNVAWELAERIAGELLALLRSSAPYVRTEADWRTVCALLKLTSGAPLGWGGGGGARGMETWMDDRRAATLVNLPPEPASM